MKITNISGYLVIANDILLNFFESFWHRNAVFASPCDYVNGHTIYCWKGEFGEMRLKNLSKYLNEISPTNIDNETLTALKDIISVSIYCISDIYYIPQRFGKKYRTLSQLCFAHSFYWNCYASNRVVVRLTGYEKIWSHFVNQRWNFFRYILLAGSCAWW